jgi:hypothetical protein
MKLITSRNIGFAFVLAGVLGLLHHYIIVERFFDMKDILNHEFFEAIFLTAGIVLIITSFTKQK